MTNADARAVFLSAVATELQHAGCETSTALAAHLLVRLAAVGIRLTVVPPGPADADWKSLPARTTTTPPDEYLAARAAIAAQREG